MSNGSFYFRDNPAFVGGSPQAIYEELWERGRRQRLIQRGIVAGVALVLGVKLFSPAWGVFLALVAAGCDAGLHWWRRAVNGVWRRGQRGEQRTARVLRLTLEMRGHRVLHGRSVPGQKAADHLVIGPTGVWVVNNQSWDPETEFAVYGDKIFIGKDSASGTAVQLLKTAEMIAKLLSEELRTEITAQPLLIAHGGKLPRRGLTGSGITLLRVHRLPGWILRHGLVGDLRLTPAQVEAVTQAAIHRLPIGGHTVR